MGHSVQRQRSDRCFGLLPPPGARTQPAPDNSFKPKERGLDQASAVIANHPLPGRATHGLDMSQASIVLRHPPVRVGRCTPARRERQSHAAPHRFAVHLAVIEPTVDRELMRTPGNLREQRSKLRVVGDRTIRSAISPVRSSTPRCSLRQVRCLILPCCRTCHSPSPKIFRPEASMTRCRAAPRRWCHARA